MGVITVIINDRIERELRKIAKTRFRDKRGFLGKAINEALEEWMKKKGQEDINKSLVLLEEGIDMGKLKSKREDWHER